MRNKRKHKMNPGYEEWLKSRYRPVAGADGEDDPDPADGDPNPADPAPGDDPTDGDPPNPDDPDGDPNPDADDDELERIKRERDEARDRVARAEAAAQKAKQDARKAREEAAKKHGNWEQVARERESELQEANERATTAEQRAITAEENLDKFQREVRISRFATKLSFRDPQDAIQHLKDSPDKTGDDKSCERALRELAKQKPYLVDERRARGRAMNGDNGNSGLLTKEQMDAMSSEEVQQAMATGLIQKSLAALSPASRTG